MTLDATHSTFLAVAERCSILLMTRRRSLLLIPIALLVSAVIVGISTMVPRTTYSGPTYTPHTLVTFFHFHPALLGQPGHVFQVHGALTPTMENGLPRYLLHDAADNALGSGMWIAPGPANPFIAFLRGVPLLGAVIPPTPDHPVTERPVTYSIRISSGCTSPATCRLVGWEIESSGE